MRSTKQRSYLFLILAFLFSGLIPTQCQAAPTLELSTANNCTSAWGSGSPAYTGPANKVYAPYAVTITSATIPYISPYYYYGSLEITIYNDNAGTPGTALSGNLANSTFSQPLATLTGSITIPSAGYYWVQLGSTTSGEYNCFKTSIDYTGSAVGWVVYTGMKQGTAGSGNIATSWQNWAGQTGSQMAFNLYSSGAATISLSANKYFTDYRAPVVLTATGSTSGSVGFYADGKAIPGCKNIVVPSTTGTCSWKPSIHKTFSVYALFKPAVGLSVKSSLISVAVSKRTNTR